MGENVHSSKQQLQDTISSLVGKLFLEDLARDRDALEDAAMERVCACRHYDLADTLHETPDEDLMAIVIKANPCDICGE